MQAQVVPAAFEDRERRLPAERLLQRFRELREVSVDELALERDRRGGDHDGGFLFDGVPDRGDEVRERLAGARAGLDGEVLAGADRLAHGLGHLDLALALGATDRLDGMREEFVDARKVRSCGHGSKR